MAWFETSVSREKCWELKDLETEESMECCQGQKWSVLEKYFSINPLSLPVLHGWVNSICLQWTQASHSTPAVFFPHFTVLLNPSGSTARPCTSVSLNVTIKSRWMSLFGINWTSGSFCYVTSIYSYQLEWLLPQTQRDAIVLHYWDILQILLCCRHVPPISLNGR